jgi:hypothetical protein
MKHYINNIEVTPRNRTEIGFNASFTNLPNDIGLNVDRIILPREAKQIIDDHIALKGVFEAIPYKITLGTISLDFMVDLLDNAVYRDFEIEVSIKRVNGIDTLIEDFRSTSFELLKSKGVSYNYIDVPYIIVADNQGEMLFMLSVTLYIMTKELIQAVKDLVSTIGDFADIISIGLVVNIGAILAASLKLIAQIAYTASVLYAVIKLGQQLFEIIFPKIRYYSACKVQELLTKSCAYFGLGFQSTLLNANQGLTILPVPLNKNKKGIFDYLKNDLNFSYTKGHPTSQDSVRTLYDLMDAVQTMFNAEMRVYSGNVYIEQRTYWEDLALNSVIPALNIQDKRQNEYTLNVDEVWKRYLINYQPDYSDTHTLDNWEKNSIEYSTEPIFPNSMVSIKGFNNANIPFSLGKRKDKLNFIEKTAKELFKVIDNVTGVFGGGTNLVSKIDNRIGILQISQQYYSQTKLLYTIANGKQPQNYIDLIGVDRLWNDYHYINQIQLNDYAIYEKARTMLNFEQFVQILSNNYVNLGVEKVKVLQIEWQDEKAYAYITYQKRNKYAENRVKTIRIDE